MRPQTELAAGIAVLSLLALGAAALGTRGRRELDFDPRRSTFLTGPEGAQGYAEALARLGVNVERFRRRPGELATAVPDAEPTVLALLGPSAPPDLLEAMAVVEFAGRHDLLLAGPEANAVMRCYGYAARPRGSPILAVMPGRPADQSDLRVRAVLGRTASGIVRDSAAWDEDGRLASCEVPEPLAIDTLLRTAGGRSVALRLTLAGGRAVTLVADDAIFSNRALRASDAGPFALRLVAGRYRRMLVDEYHQGYGPSGSLLRAVAAWSTRSPWGWAGWQLAAVGLIGLAAAAVRFGPVRPAPGRRRRSPLEHVRALATVLAASGGHDLAVRLMAQGLRRRLSRGLQAGRGPGLRADPRPWLAELAPHLRSRRGREAAASLVALTDRPQDAEGVLRAAHVVEDVWEELKP
jgi:uncharacterized protein DUF4350